MEGYCSGKECVIKDKCYRYTTEIPNHNYWAYKNPPFIIKDGVFKCDMFWGENANNIFSNLKNIMKTEADINNIEVNHEEIKNKQLYLR